MNESFGGTLVRKVPGGRGRGVQACSCAVLIASFCALATSPNLTSARAAADTTTVTDTVPGCVVPTQLGLVMIIDDSGSMYSTDPSELRAEAASIAVDQVKAGSVVSSSNFDGSARTIFQPTTVTDTARAGLKSAIRGSLGSGGGTDYESAFLEAQRQLGALPKTVDRRAVLFLSDGQPNSAAYTADRPIAAAGTPIYTIGFGTASMVELAGISARSGGQHFTAAGAADLQHVVGNIAAILGCNAQNIVEQVQLQPGGTRSIPFSVDTCERELRSLAAWETGTIDVWLTRPDGSRLDASNIAGWERYVRESTYVSVNSTQPPTGAWTLNLASAQRNMSDVNVTVNVWGRRCSTPDPGTQDAPRTCVAVALSRGWRSSVDFSWRPVSPHPLLEGYQVQTTPKGKPRWTTHPITSAPTIRISGHNPGSSWTYRVRSMYSDGAVSDWCTVAVTIPIWSLLQGSDRRNRMKGSRGRDLIDGRGGNDGLDGRGGTDLVHGGRGNDVVFGGPGNDRLTGGAGRDIVIGGAGADTIDVRDRRGGDVVRCGGGRDTVFADRTDRLARDCERARRMRAPKVTRSTRGDEPGTAQVALAFSTSYGGAGGAPPVFGNGTAITPVTSGATSGGGTVTIGGVVVNPTPTNGGTGTGTGTSGTTTTGTTTGTGSTSTTSTGDTGATTATTTETDTGTTDTATDGTGTTTSATGATGTTTTTTTTAPGNGGGRPTSPGGGNGNGRPTGATGGGTKPGSGRPTRT